MARTCRGNSGTNARGLKRSDLAAGGATEDSAGEGAATACGSAYARTRLLRVLGGSDGRGRSTDE